jgi:hypothetical protein
MGHLDEIAKIKRILPRLRSSVMSFAGRKDMLAFGRHGWELSAGGPGNGFSLAGSEGQEGPLHESKNEKTEMRQGFSITKDMPFSSRLFVTGNEGGCIIITQMVW